MSNMRRYVLQGYYRNPKKMNPCKLRCGTFLKMIIVRTILLPHRILHPRHQLSTPGQPAVAAFYHRMTWFVRKLKQIFISFLSRLFKRSKYVRRKSNQRCLKYLLSLRYHQKRLEKLPKPSRETSTNTITTCLPRKIYG